MNDQIIATLQNLRVQLKECASLIDIAAYRDDLVKDLVDSYALQHREHCQEDAMPRVVANHLDELKRLEKREVELAKTRDASKDLQNKMKYSNIVKQISVTKNKVLELKKEIHHLLRTSETMVNNQQRFKLEVEKLDSIIYKTIKDQDLSTLRTITREYEPLVEARQRALAAMKTTVKELEEIRNTTSTEQVEHRDAVEETKRDIKRAKADIDAISNGTYREQLQFNSELTGRCKARSSEMNNRRQAMVDEIEKLKMNISEGICIHSANMAALLETQSELSQQLKDITNTTASTINEIDTRLAKLKLEQADHETALEKLEELEKEEIKEKERQADDERLRLKINAEIKAQEEKEYFAALLIQFRWKAHMKRQLLKVSTKGKKGKAKGGKKKK